MYWDTNNSLQDSISLLVLSSLPGAVLKAEIHNHLFGTCLFITLCQTLWTTILIVFFFKKKNILRIIAQSSLFYPLALVANALFLAIPENNSNVITLSLGGIWVVGILPSITVCPEKQ